MNTVESAIRETFTRLGLAIRAEHQGALVRLRWHTDLGVFPARELARQLALLPADHDGAPPFAPLQRILKGLPVLRGGWLALPSRVGLRFDRGRPVELNLGERTPEVALLRAEELLGCWLRVDRWTPGRVACAMNERRSCYRLTYVPRAPVAPSRTEIVAMVGNDGFALPNSRSADSAPPHAKLWTLLPNSDPLSPESWHIIAPPPVAEGEEREREVRHSGYTCHTPIVSLAIERIVPFEAALVPVMFSYGGWQNANYRAISGKDSVRRQRLAFGFDGRATKARRQGLQPWRLNIRSTAERDS